MIADGGTDSDPIYARDGTKFSFLRSGSVWLANADGSAERMIVAGPVGWFDWSDSADRIVVQAGAPEKTSVVDLASGATTVLDLGVDHRNPTWRPGHDVEAGIDRVIPRDASEANELSPLFSPDGSTLLIERHGTHAAYEVADGELGYRLMLVPVDGSGSQLPIGPAHHSGTGGANVEFSPDGTQVLATYKEDWTTWLIDVDGSRQEQLPWTGRNGTTWQRLAP